MLSLIFDVLTLQSGYNSAVVVVGASLLGAGGGVIGAFSFLRKRAMISDAISHATLPGVALGFMAAVALGVSGRSLPMLLGGAMLSGILGILMVQWIKDHTRLPEDTAIGTVLSVFFGAGIVLLSYVQTIKAGGQAGLNSFLLGSTAAMRQDEAELIGVAAAVVSVVALLMLKEFALVCFDEDYARAQGWRTRRIDLLMMFLLLAVVSIGLKTVGLVLIIALVIIPPVAARFWTERLHRMVVVSAVFGALSGYIGSTMSAVLPRLPAGGVIVLTAGALFLISLLIAPSRGVLFGSVRRARYRRRVVRRQALAALWRGDPPTGRLPRLILRAEGLIAPDDALTERGRREAREAARTESLWHQFMRDRPDDAFALSEYWSDPIEHALPADSVRELERSLGASGRAAS